MWQSVRGSITTRNDERFKKQVRVFSLTVQHRDGHPVTINYVIEMHRERADRVGQIFDHLVSELEKQHGDLLV